MLKGHISFREGNFEILNVSRCGFQGQQKDLSKLY